MSGCHVHAHGKTLTDWKHQKKLIKAVLLANFHHEVLFKTLVVLTLLGFCVLSVLFGVSSLPFSFASTESK